MPDYLDSILFGRPNAGAFASTLYGRQPTANDLLPQIDPAEERSTAGWALENALGGLGWIGSTLDKAFGARALRGVLGGNTDELASIIPFSDTLGITDPSNEVTGRDLLADAGIVSRRNEGDSFSWEDDIPGMLAEIALDPSTYLSLGLTGAGKVAQKAGKLGSGWGTQMRAGQRGLTANLPFSRGNPLELLSGQNVLDLGSTMRSAATIPTRGADAVLDATLGLTPFSGVQRRVYENVGEPLGRYASRVFDDRVLDEGGKVGQDVARSTDAFNRVNEAARLGNQAELTDIVGKIAGPGASPDFFAETQQALQYAMEQAQKADQIAKMQSGAVTEAAERIRQWHTPGTSPYDVENLAGWEKNRGIPYAPLSPANQAIFDAEVPISTRSLIDGVLPGGAPLPTENNAAALLNASRDLIDEGYQVRGFMKDASGKPMTFYHGTPVSGIQEFTPSAGFQDLGPGVYFSKNKSYAEGYMGGRDIEDFFEGSPAKPGSELHEVRLAVQNPIYSDQKVPDSVVQLAKRYVAENPDVDVDFAEMVADAGKLHVIDLVQSDDADIWQGIFKSAGYDAVANRDLSEIAVFDSRNISKGSGDSYRFEPTPGMVLKPKDEILDRIINANHPPGTIDYMGLHPWMNDPLADVTQLAVRPGPLQAATEKAVKDAIAGGQRLKPISIPKALEFEIPRGNQDLADWAPKNLDPDRLQLFNDFVGKNKADLAHFTEAEKRLGATGGVLSDSYIDYIPRHMAQFPSTDPRSKTIPSAKQFTKDLVASHEAFEARKDYLKNVPGGSKQINEWTIDPRLSGPNASFTPEQAQEFLREELTGMKFPAKGNSAWKEAEKIEEFLRAQPEWRVTNKSPFFSTDLPTLLTGRQAGFHKIAGAEHAFMDAFKRFGNDKASWAAQGVTDVTSAYDMLQAMKLTGSDAGGSIAAQKLAAAGKIPQTVGKQSVEDLKNLFIPSADAKDMMRFGQGWQTPESLKPVAELYNQMADITRGWLTRPFLSFHVRNLVSGLFNTWRSGAIGFGTALDDAKTAKDVVGFLRGGDFNSVKGLDKDSLWKELVAGKIAFGPNTSVNADVIGSGGEIVSKGLRRPEATGKSMLGDAGARLRTELDEIKANPNPLSKESPLNPLNPKNSILEVMSDGGQKVEDFVRVNHYVNLRKQGWTPEAAAEEVLKYQIDYTRLSNTEKGVFKKVLPWYSFSKGVLPPLLEDLVSQPAKLTGSIRAATGFRPQGEFVPSYIGEGTAVPLGENPDGSQRYLSSFGLPFEDESFKTLGSLAKGDPSRVLEQVLGAAYPWFKTPLEMAFNKQLYSGRPLTDLKPYEFADLGGLLNEKQARGLTEIAANTPASRTLSTANKLLDERKSPLDQIIALATGARLTDVDASRAYNTEITKVLGEQLQGQPGIRTRTEVYSPVDQIPNLSPEDQVRMRLYLQAEQRMREIAKQKAAQGK